MFVWHNTDVSFFCQKNFRRDKKNVLALFFSLFLLVFFSLFLLFDALTSMHFVDSRKVQLFSWAFSKLQFQKKKKCSHFVFEKMLSKRRFVKRASSSTVSLAPKGQFFPLSNPTKNVTIDKNGEFFRGFLNDGTCFIDKDGDMSCVSISDAHRQTLFKTSIKRFARDGGSSFGLFVARGQTISRGEQLVYTGFYEHSSNGFSHKEFARVSWADKASGWRCNGLFRSSASLVNGASEAEANVRFVRILLDDEIVFAYEAKRDIEAGEELLVYYGDDAFGVNAVAARLGIGGNGHDPWSRCWSCGARSYSWQRIARVAFWKDSPVFGLCVFCSSMTSVFDSVSAIEEKEFLSTLKLKLVVAQLPEDEIG